MVRALWTNTNYIKSWVPSKKGAVNLVGLKRCCVFWAASKQPNDQLRCLLPTTCEVEGINQREKARIGNWQRNRVPPRQCEASLMFGNTYDTIGKWTKALPKQPKKLTRHLAMIVLMNALFDIGLRNFVPEILALKRSTYSNLGWGFEDPGGDWSITNGAWDGGRTARQLPCGFYGLKRIGKVKTLEMCVPHDLNNRQKLSRS